MRNTPVAGRRYTTSTLTSLTTSSNSPSATSASIAITTAFESATDVKVSLTRISTTGDQTSPVGPGVYGQAGSQTPLDSTSILFIEETRQQQQQQQQQQFNRPSTSDQKLYSNKRTDSTESLPTQHASLIRRLCCCFTPSSNKDSNTEEKISEETKGNGGMLRFLKSKSNGSGNGVASPKNGNGSSENKSFKQPIPVAKLRSAQDLAAQLAPSSIPDEDRGDIPEDGLTQEDKMLAISLLDASGRTRQSNGAVKWSVPATKNEKGEIKTPAYNINYGWVCQTGFYPEDLDKKNQDNLLVEAPFDDIPSRGLFGVFDGHGKAGTECSTFAVNNLSGNIRGAPEYKNKANVEDAYRTAFLKTNKEMHAQKKLRKTSAQHFDDAHAGTTAICCMVDGNEVIVANVGDSRAVLASNMDGRLTAMPLSIDQTPYRKDERERCQRSGAVVMTMDQLEGYKPYDPNADEWGTEEDDDGDPPRLWLPNRGGPGVAFTRSLGDEVAEQIGCNADPEILRQKLTQNDKFIVICSDGVFEFLSSQTVVDMVAQFTDPVLAAQALVAEAYKLWLHYEVRTDDITAIVIFLSDMEDSPASAGAHKMGRKSGVGGSFRDLHAVLKLDKESRPVRREMSRKKREMIAAKMVETHDDEAETPRATTPRKVFPKTDLEKEQINNSVKANFLFQHLNPSQMEDLMQAFEKQVVKKDETIIMQGDQGDRFYVVASGEYDCFVTRPTDENATSTSDAPTEEPKLVQRYIASEGHVGNPSFGELALMYSKPRAATVIATTDGTLWAMDRLTFRKALIKHPNREIVKTLRQVPVLATLGRSQVQRLADILTAVEYENDDMIITQGGIGDIFYVVKSGSVRCTINDPEDEAACGLNGKEVMRIQAGGYFGERALLQSEPRAANVIAVGPTSCLYISRQAFEEVLGPLGDLMALHSRVREAESLGLVRVEKRKQEEGIMELGIGRFILKAQVMEQDIGKVSLVTCQDNNKVYTIKTFIRTCVEQEKEIERVKRDRLVNLVLGGEEQTNRGLATLLGTFVGTESVHMLYKEVLTGELASFMNHDSLFELATVKFLTASMIQLLGGMHSYLALCRSVNPDMLMLSDTGTLKLIDLRCSKVLEDPNDRTFTMCGAATFLAPEQILNRGHTFAADWWAVGALVYELLAGHSPFSTSRERLVSASGSSKDLLKVNDDRVKSRQASVVGGGLFSKITQLDASALEFPESVPEDCAAFVRMLLTVGESKRLGSRGVEEVKDHMWMRDFEFESLAHMEDPEHPTQSPLFGTAESALKEMQQDSTNKPVDQPDTADKTSWFSDF